MTGLSCSRSPAVGTGLVESLRIVSLKESEMKIPHAQHAFVAILVTLFASAALASGDHAGGHAHGDESSAIGMPGKAAQVTRTVHVDMTDNMRFTPASMDVKQGETIRFKVKNSGRVKHEFVLGTEQELKAHYQAMLKYPEMAHEDPQMITLAGGEQGEVIWQFTKAGKVDFACLQPGHYDAGMKGAVTVARSGAKAGSARPGAAADGQAEHSH